MTDANAELVTGMLSGLVGVILGLLISQVVLAIWGDRIIDWLSRHSGG
jgi:hypothetical protein